MKIAVIYESIYGNTAAVAQAVAEGLRALGEVDVRAVGDESVEADLLVVGAPTHAHGLPSSMTRKAIEAAAEEAEAKGNLWGAKTSIRPPASHDGSGNRRRFLTRPQSRPLRPRGSGSHPS